MSAGARACVPAPLFMGAMPGAWWALPTLSTTCLPGLTGVAERIQELDMICIVPAAVCFEGQPLLDYMMPRTVMWCRRVRALPPERGENNDTRSAAGVRRGRRAHRRGFLTWTANSRCCRPVLTSLRISNSTRLT